MQYLQSPTHQICLGKEMGVYCLTKFRLSFTMHGSSVNCHTTLWCQYDSLRLTCVRYSRSTVGVECYDAKPKRVVSNGCRESGMPCITHLHWLTASCFAFFSASVATPVSSVAPFGECCSATSTPIRKLHVISCPSPWRGYLRATPFMRFTHGSSLVSK